MLNIISRSIVSTRVSGPRKVVENLIKGLDAIGYPYVVNARLDTCKRVWIHDDTVALREVLQLPQVCPIVGPNLYVTPRQIPSDLDLSKTLYLHPSPWVVTMWQEAGFARAPLAAWPTGIDTNLFTLSQKPKTNVLVYFKERYPEELAYVEELLQAQSISYEVVRYGHYSEPEYQAKLASTRYGIWIGRQESQGIALQEALAMNVPLVVWDVPRLGHWQADARAMAVFNEQENNFTGATSAYYFDSRCGFVTRAKAELGLLLGAMEKDWQSFTPRAYILQNLSLEKQATELVRLFESHYGLSFSEGMEEKAEVRGNWKNAQLPFRLLQRSKDILKTIVR